MVSPQRWNEISDASIVYFQDSIEGVVNKLNDTFGGYEFSCVFKVKDNSVDVVSVSKSDSTRSRIFVVNITVEDESDEDSSNIVIANYGLDEGYVTLFSKIVDSRNPDKKLGFKAIEIPD